VAESMTKTSGKSVKAFLSGIETDEKRRDAEAILKLMRQVTGEAPKMWGDSIVGFGKYRYKYESGHEGETCLVGFSPRKAAFTIYLMGNYFPDSKAKAEELLGRLGKHSMGKGCLYVKKLADVDLKVLEELVTLSVEKLREHYPN
jgi:hypothetical protein